MNPGLVLIAIAIFLALATVILEEKYDITPFIFQGPAYKEEEWMSELDLIVFVFSIVIFIISFLFFVKMVIQMPEFFIIIQLKQKEEK